MLIAGVAATLVVGLIAFYVAVTQSEEEAASLARQVDDRKPAIAAAETLIDRVNYGRTFFETRTPVLDCLSELSAAFNYDETIFVTNYGLNSAFVGELKGKAAEERLVLALLDRLKANKKFTNVQMSGELRATGNQNREYSFSISFRFTPAAPTAPTEAAR
jgi:hypothetical protein